jgi:hypothetical protein
LTERRNKGIMTRIVEIVTLLIGLGVIGLSIQIGEYKANFKTLCDKVVELKVMIDANAAENTATHLRIRQDLNKTQQTLVAHTGHPIQ